MISQILSGICAVVFFYLSYRYAIGRPSGFPPGPPRLPIFGSYLFMMLTDFTYLHKALIKFSKWYKSDIIGFHIGNFPVVAVHNADGVRKVLHSSDFDGRGQMYMFAMREPTEKILGVFFREGPIWKEQRRFVLRYLRDFGFGRRFEELELVIKEEIGDLINLIRNGPSFKHEEQFVQKGGYRILMPHVINPFTINSLFHVIFNERVASSERADVFKLVRMGMQFQRVGDNFGKMLSIIPWVRHIFPNWSAYNQLDEANKFIYKFYQKIVDRHIETYDPSAERNFIDLYIAEMKKQTAINPETSFNREQFIMSMVDFTFPAFSAIGTQLSFLFQYFLLYPEVMKRIQKEIDDVVGSGRLPTLDDRQFLHYSEATVREILRIETLVASDVPHKAMVDTELMGYKIPKDTIVVPGLYAYHNDSRVWGDPQNFRPDRFLDEEGKLSLKKDVSFPFGAGKRLCAGETFARNFLFLLTTAICQNFNVVLGPYDKLPDLSKTMSGLITSPPDFWLQLEDRK